jgi:hypothetical protein
MPRKIYDIKSPKVAVKTEKEIKEFLSQDPKPIKRSAAKKKERKSSRKIWVIAIILILLAAGGYLYFKLQKVSVKIWPKLENFSYEQTVTASQSFEIVDLSENLIPAKYIEIEKIGNKDFNATGNASDEGKAMGTITVYNKYSPATSITLKQGTHFLSDSGKYFKTLERIVIPAATTSGGKITPGSIEAKVEATEGGDGYNIGPANFSVPKLSGSPYYYSIYGISKDAMVGGFAGSVKKITESDISEAKSEIIKSISAESLEDIKSQLDADYMLLDDAVFYETLSSGTDAKSGEIKEQFNYRATVKTKALAFKKSDLDKFAKNYIISEMSEDYAVLESSIKLEYALKSINIKDSEATIEIKFSADIYRNINKNLLSLLLTGKNKNQINETINNNLSDSVSRVEISFFPFWITKSPKSQKAVEIELNFQ